MELPFKPPTTGMRRALIGLSLLAAVIFPRAVHAQAALVKDPSNSSFAASATLTPSGTAGTAGKIGGVVASSANTGRSFGWNCAAAGLGTVTLLDGSVRQVWFWTNSGADVRGDSFAIEDAEPPSGIVCTFQVYR